MCVYVYICVYLCVYLCVCMHVVNIYMCVHEEREASVIVYSTSYIHAYTGKWSFTYENVLEQ